MSLEEFLKQYIETALWSTTDESTPEGGEPLDNNYTPEDISPDTLALMRADCEKFLNENDEDIRRSAGFQSRHGTEYERAGHDFWLTRNRHGAGFWDGDWPEDVGERLTEASHAYGEVNLYVGDDGKIYQS